MQRILVLGANGFVGRHLVEALAREGTCHPIALVRAAGPPFGPGVETRRGDATNAAQMRLVLRGVTQAVNCIAGSADTMVAATRILCDEAPTAEVGRLVHLSSMAVYGRATGLVGESHALDPSAGPYGRAKVECERLIEAFAGAGGDAVILRPGCIHGPGSQQWTGRIARLLRQHRIGDLGAAGDGVCNLTFIADLLQAVTAALRQAGARGQAFNISDPDPVTWNQYFVRLGRAIRAVPVRRISGRWMKVETSLLAPPLRIAGIASGTLRLRLSLPDAIPPSLARSWRQEIVLDHRKADALLGFPRTDPDEAIAAAAGWFRAAA